MEDLNFIPVDREIKIAPNKVMISKLTPDGAIDYINDYFTEISGYEVHELVGESVDIFKHPEIPSIIFELIMRGMSEKKNINFILKNQAKDGRYYWFITDFEYKTSPEGEITSIICHRRTAPSYAVIELAKFYSRLLKIEKNAGMQIADKYFEGFLEEKGMTFHEYTLSLLNTSETILDESVEFNKISPEKIKKKPIKKDKSLFDKLFKK